MPDTIADSVKMRRRTQEVIEALNRMTNANIATLTVYQTALQDATLNSRADAAEIEMLRAQVARLQAVNNSLRNRPRQPTCGNCGAYGHRSTQCSLPHD